MPHFVIISASTRNGRLSHRVSLFLHRYILINKSGSVEILDLKEYNFPVFNDPVYDQENPSPLLKEFESKINKADSVLIVTPEYNGGYPASLKNIIDVIYNSWNKKTIGLATVSSGDFAGSQIITSLQFTLWKLKASVVPFIFQVPRAEENFNEDGFPLNKSSWEKRAFNLIKEILWKIEAGRRMELPEQQV
jgi:NAD(P)H-dependent FMN reductase